MVLSSCPKLRSLFLSRNPVEKLSKYRSVVAFLLSGVEMLDGTPLDTSHVAVYSSSLMDEAQEELNLIQEEIDDELRLFEDAIGPTDGDNSFLMPIGTSPRLQRGQDNLPDTGSELTHGSAVVLAGNMAAAMRKRRVGGDSANGLLVEDEKETALDMLDSALRAKTPTTRSSSDKVSFVAEGDITEIVMGSPQRKPHIAMSPARPLGGGKAGHHMGVSTSFEVDPASSSSSRRPKSAFSGSSLRHSDKTYEATALSPSKSPPEKDERQRAASPRQRNSSRPQSAAVSPAEVSSLFNDRNLPFVISRATLRDGDDGEEDSEEDDTPRVKRDILVKREVKETPRDKLAAKGATGSLVHQNMVRRFKTDAKPAGPRPTSGGGSSSLVKMPLPSIGDDFHISDESDEDEDLAVTHSERLKFMAKKDDKVASLNRSRQATLKKLQGLTTDSNVTMEGESTQTSLRSSPSASVTQLAASAAGGDKSTSVEKQLGFNLAGSLAAIDRWVQDVDSGDDESEADGEKEGSSGRVDAWRVEQRRPGTASSQSTNGTRPPSGKDGNKILSRDAIFNLCWNASEKRPDSRNSSRSGSRPSSGVRKGSVGSLGSEADGGSGLSESEFGEKLDRRKPPSSQRKTPHQKAPLPKSTETSALQLSDAEIVAMLRKPPKTVVMLRTKASFQDFFRGIDMERFHRLLHEAYADIPDPRDRESKIARRMSLMEGS